MSIQTMKIDPAAKPITPVGDPYEVADCSDERTLGGLTTNVDELASLVGTVIRDLQDASVLK